MSQIEVKKDLKKYWVEQLILHNFRNYDHFKLELSDKPIIICGPNGVGKTNILEAISLLSPGKGFRSATIGEIRNENTDHPWKIDALVNGLFKKSQIEVAQIKESRTFADRKQVKIDQEVSKNKDELAHIFSVIWLIPQMDHLFIDGANIRRKFFDRIIYNFEQDHSTNLLQYEHHLKERLRLLRDGRYDSSWLEFLEQKIAYHGTKIALARNQIIEIISKQIEFEKNSFPKPTIKIDGQVEQLSGQFLENELVQFYQEKLKEHRAIDGASGKSNFGIHKTDFAISHQSKMIEAAKCSTGEQKALLISIIMAYTKAKIKKDFVIPVVLLDEVVAHLDKKRRSEFFQEMLELGIQAWITGTDTKVFEEIKLDSNVIAL